MTAAATGPDAGGTEGPGPTATRSGDGPSDDGVFGLVRPHLRDIEPYTTARSQHQGGVLLDANENALGPLVPEAGGELHRYPHPGNPELKEALSAWLGVPAARLWVGNGSDEAIDLLVRTLVSPGEAVVVPVPTYGVYEARARAHAAEVRTVPLDGDFDLDVARTAERARGAKLVLLCSPNNPTGNRLSPRRVLELVDRCRAVVAVDEAYVEFARADSLAPRAGPTERLAVIRTFSKAWGLAGARVGYLVASPELVAFLDRAGLPYPLSSPSARTATLALSRTRRMERRVERIREERARLAGALEEMGLRVLPSEANFLLFFVDDPPGVQRRLAAGHGVVVRDRSALPGLSGALRVTVGTPAENDRFLRGLAGVL